jgi:glycosyltransferase involved in cell wall biosynthesis
MTLPEKPVVAVYSPHYLTLSMTFVYRQLLGVTDEFNPIILAESVSNTDIFPFNSIYSRCKTLPERILCKILRELTGKYNTLSPLQIAYWKNILKNKETKLIHSHFGPAGLQMLPLAKALDLPLLVTFHGYDASTLLREATYCAGLRNLFEYAHIIAVSRDMADRLQEFGAKPVTTHVHYIGVPTEDFRFVSRLPIREKIKIMCPINFLQVSNFVEKKGHLYTVRAFKEFLNFYPASNLTLAGDGPLLDSIRKLCNDLELKDHIQFVGKVSKLQVIDLMKNADIFLHHSITAENGDQEGIPTVLMEAMATGLIVVSTVHSGIPELICDGQTGFLARERDVSGYVQKIISALNSSPGLPKNAAQSVQDRFNLSRQNKKLKEIYENIIADWRRRI